MKKAFLLFLISGISSFTLFAQPTLTSATEPTLGGIIKTSSADPTGLSQGPSGANQTWDFSNVTTLGSGTANYVSPASTPDASYYPNATLATSDGAGDYGYFKITSSEIDLLGAAEGAGYATYTDGEKALSFPFTYNNSFTDNFSGSGVTSYPFTRTGTVKVKADAYGTIKTPAGTFNNVLRINMLESIYDTFPDLEYGQVYSYQSYLWYANGFPNSLFTLTSDTTFFAGIPEVSQLATYSTEGPSGVSTINPSVLFNVFPNPATDKIYLITDQSIIRATVSNVLGQNVIDMQPEKGTAHNPVELSLADLPAGIYFCNITTPAGNAARQIVKE